MALKRVDPVQDVNFFPNSDIFTATAHSHVSSLELVRKVRWQSHQIK